jgi:hypothetical protein
MITYCFTKTLLRPKHEFCVIHNGFHYVDNINEVLLWGGGGGGVGKFVCLKKNLIVIFI